MIRRRKPLQRSGRPRARRPGPPRRGPARDAHYLEFLRENGKCRACQIEQKRGERWDTGTLPWRCGVDPMHGPVNGMSSKGPDTEAIPGCRLHHDEQTRLGWPAFEAKYGFTRAGEAAAWRVLFECFKEIR